MRSVRTKCGARVEADGAIFQALWQATPRQVVIRNTLPWLRTAERGCCRVRTVPSNLASYSLGHPAHVFVLPMAQPEACRRDWTQCAWRQEDQGTRATSLPRYRPPLYSGRYIDMLHCKSSLTLPARPRTPTLDGGIFLTATVVLTSIASPRRLAPRALIFFLFFFVVSGWLGGRRSLR